MMQANADRDIVLIVDDVPENLAVLSDALIVKFGAGWFILPNPAYGTALKGGIDEIFPADKRWASPATPEKYAWPGPATIWRRAPHVNCRMGST